MNHMPRHDALVRHDWTREEALALYDLPLSDLILEAQQRHRRFFDANQVQMSTLLSIKTGGCAENCGYCSQSAHFDTGLKATKLMEVEAVLAEARAARDAGASRFCMGAAWRNPKDRDLDQICAMIGEVRALGLETCATLGMLTRDQAARLAEAGLDYYNHNLDTSPEHYAAVVTTRTYEERLDTLENVRAAGMKVCCGGILGLGESRADRAGLLVTLANLPSHPESVPINNLVRIKGTPLGEGAEVEPLEFVRTIAVAKIMMPASVVRLSAGREQMSDELQALCFLAGAGSIFVGPRLLTTPNPKRDADDALLRQLGISAIAAPEPQGGPAALNADAGDRSHVHGP